MPPKCGGPVMSRVIAVVACGLSLAACSTSMPSLDFLKSSPQTEALRIESEPAGAEAKTSLGQSCRTPCELTVQAGSEVSVTLALNGYQPQTVAVRPDSGSSQLAPNPVVAQLQPMAPAKKPAAKKPKKPVTAARPAPAPKTASAAPPPAPAVAAPAEPTEPAASATNYPWPSR